MKFVLVQLLNQLTYSGMFDRTAISTGKDVICKWQFIKITYIESIALLYSPLPKQYYTVTNKMWITKTVKCKLSKINNKDFPLVHIA